MNFLKITRRWKGTSYMLGPVPLFKPKAFISFMFFLMIFFLSPCFGMDQRLEGVLERAKQKVEVYNSKIEVIAEAIRGDKAKIKELEEKIKKLEEDEVKEVLEKVENETGLKFKNTDELLEFIKKSQKPKKRSSRKSCLTTELAIVTAFLMVLAVILIHHFFLIPDDSYRMPSDEVIEYCSETLRKLGANALPSAE